MLKTAKVIFKDFIVILDAGEPLPSQFVHYLQKSAT